MAHIIGLDHGNGWFKVKSEFGEIVLPSTFVAKNSIGEDLMGKKLALNEFESNIEPNVKYLWGKDIAKVDSDIRISTYGMQDRYTQLRYRQLTEFGLASVLKGDKKEMYDVWVVTGVPSSEKGTAKEEQLIKALEGTHVVKVNDVEKIIKVSKVIVLAQPVGTVLSLYLDKDGYVANENYEEDYLVGIIDIGSGTTDIDTVQSLRRNKDSFSINMGVSDIIDDIVAYINKENPNLSIERQDIEPILEKTEYKKSTRTAAINFDEIKKDSIRRLAVKITDRLAQTWKTFDKFDEVIITGGGAALLKEELSKLIEDIAVMEDSQKANVEGFYRYGQTLKGE